MRCKHTAVHLLQGSGCIHSQGALERYAPPCTEHFIRDQLAESMAQRSDQQSVTGGALPEHYHTAVTQLRTCA